MKFTLHKFYPHSGDELWYEDVQAKDLAEAKRKVEVAVRELQRRGQWPWEVEARLHYAGRDSAEKEVWVYEPPANTNRRGSWSQINMGI